MIIRTLCLGYTYIHYHQGALMTVSRTQEIPLHQKPAPRTIRFPSPWLYFMLLFLGPTPQSNIFCPNSKCVGRVVIRGIKYQQKMTLWLFASWILKCCIQSFKKAAVLLLCSESREKRKQRWQAWWGNKERQPGASLGSTDRCTNATRGDRGRPLGLGSCSGCHGKAVQYYGL